MGQQGIQLVHPHSLQELAITNAVMRLMAQDGGELPLAKYAKFKTCPQLWYDEMRDAGLNDEEVTVMEKYLKDRCGVADTQEVIMQIVMEPKVSNFNMKEANKLRKTIAKKNFRDIEGVKQMFYTKGQEVGTRKQLLDYVWNVQISMSLGYSFSAIHTSGYSLIAIQEMNLAYHYPIIYWNTACLSVDSSAINQADFYNLVEDDIVDVDEVEGKKVANKMDYAKIAAALDDFKKTCKIELPDINVSRLGFTPDEENNSILYGLKGITKLTDPAINEIMANRPYKSFEDFISKRNTKVMTIDKIINLIKSGAFNNLEKKSSEEIMKGFILSESDQKKRLTMQNANMLIDLDLLPHEFDYQMNVYKLTKELRKHRDSKKMWYFGDCLDIPENKIDLWRSIIKDSKIQGQTLDIDDTPNRRVIDSSAWDRFYKIQMETVSNYIKANSSALLTTLNDRLFKDKYEHYCSGDNLKWQLDSMNFYFDGHPLTKARSQIDVDIDRLEDIIEGKEEGFFLIKGKQIPKMHLYTIIGTVIDKDKVKGTVTIQCPDGIVNLKLYKDLFATFNTDLVNQPSFLEKGTHLMVTGVKRGPTFVPKVYKNTGRKAIVKINIDSDGNFISVEEKLDAQQNLSVEE